MLNKERRKAILALALPITVGLGSTFIMTMVDLAIVGSLGTAAVAAVGVAGFTIMLVSSLLTGVMPAVQSIVSRRSGAGSSEAKCLPLNAGLLVALCAGVPMAFICYWLVDWYFALVSPDPEVIKLGAPYLKVLVIAMPLAGLTNAFHGFWAGMGKTRVYMVNILVVNVLNAVLSVGLVFGRFGLPEMGVTGAGVATAISILASLLIYVVNTYISYPGEGLFTMKPPIALMKSVLHIGVPAVLQGAFFALGFLVFYSIVGRIGTAELAAMNVLTRFTLLMEIFARALGITAITLVSRSLGEGDPEGAERWGWDVAKIGVVWVTLLGMPLVVWPEFCLSIFLSDPATLDMASLPARVTGAFMGIGSLIYIFATVLVSLGDGKRVLFVSFGTQWLVFLPGVWIVGVMMRGGLNGIMYMQLMHIALATTMIVAIWRDGRWKRIRI